MENASRAGGQTLHTHSGFSSADHLHVPPRRFSPHHWQHVVPLDFRRKRGGPARVDSLPVGVLHLRGWIRADAGIFLVELARAFSRSERSHIWNPGGVPDFLSGLTNPDPGATLHYFLSGANPGVCLYWSVVRCAISKRIEFTCICEQWGCCMVGSRRR